MSRELDARVAEAMGYAKERMKKEGFYCDHFSISGGNVTVWIPPGVLLTEPLTPSDVRKYENPPAYSTEPAACEEVKRWLWENGYGLVINNRKDRKTHRAFVSHVKYGEEARGDECGRAIAYCTKGHEAEAKSEYEAVCLAFLAAVEAEKGA